MQEKNQLSCAISSDPRKQLKLIEKREQEEKERKDVEERERMLKMGGKGDKDDKQTAEMRQKWNKARMEEEEKMRTKSANMTALQAIPDRPRSRGTPTNLFAMSSGGGVQLPVTQGSDSMLSSSGNTLGGSANSQKSQATAQRTASAAPNFTKQHLQVLLQLQRRSQAGQTLSPSEHTTYRQLAMMYQQLKQHAQAQGRTNDPTQRTRSRSVTLKDLEFWFLKDPCIRKSKVTYKCLDSRRRKRQKT